MLTPGIVGSVNRADRGHALGYTVLLRVHSSMVEQLPLKQLVGGSSPSAPTRNPHRFAVY